jgi:hypothetical protein
VTPAARPDAAELWLARNPAWTERANEIDAAALIEKRHDQHKDYQQSKQSLRRRLAAN